MTWDDKFGVIDDVKPHHEFDDLIQRQKELETPLVDEAIKVMAEKNIKKVIDGVGQDAEIVTNEKGGKQSKSPMALHLVDPRFLKDFAADRAEALEYENEGESTVVDDDEDVDAYKCYRAIENIADFMILNDKKFLLWAMDDIDCEELNQLMTIAKVLQYGATHGNNGKGYPVNNWRLIPQEEHINHALVHIVAHLVGDTQDEHLDHALCRLMMAYATEKSDNFDYGEYIE